MAFAILFVWAFAPRAFAQGESPEYDGGEAIESTLDKDDPDRIFSVRVPWMTLTGERVYGSVGERKMTASRLNVRLRLLMRDAPAIPTHPDREVMLKQASEQQTKYAAGILSEWVENTVLALEAERRGYEVAPGEIGESLKLLAEESGRAGQDDGNGEGSLRAIGIPEEDLRGEVRDALLIEKFINEVMDARYDEAWYRQLYAASPSDFHIPPRIRAYHIYRYVDPLMPESKRNEAIKRMGKMRKQLRKRNPEYARLAQTLVENDEGTLSDTGWISPGGSMPGRLLSALFSLDVGETSEVIRDATGLHVYRVLEREAGTRFNFEEAMPQLRNYAFAKTKHLAYVSIAPQYGAQYDPDGLTRKKRVTREEYELIRGGRVEAGGVSEGSSSKRGAEARTPIKQDKRVGDGGERLRLSERLESAPGHNTDGDTDGKADSDRGAAIDLDLLLPPPE